MPPGSPQHSTASPHAAQSGLTALASEIEVAFSLPVATTAYRHDLEFLVIGEVSHPKLAPHARQPIPLSSWQLTIPFHPQVAVNLIIPRSSVYHCPSPHRCVPPSDHFRGLETPCPSCSYSVETCSVIFPNSYALWRLLAIAGASREPPLAAGPLLAVVRSSKPHHRVR